jgi:hypothetical protein
MYVSDLPFFFLPSALVALPLPRVTFSVLGMILVICDELHVLCQWLVEMKMRRREKPAEHEAI